MAVTGSEGLDDATASPCVTASVGGTQGEQWYGPTETASEPWEHPPDEDEIERLAELSRATQRGEPMSPAISPAAARAVDV